MMKILLPVDGSETALDAVCHAVQLVREGLQAEFVLANVQEPATLYEIVVAQDPQVLGEVSASAAAHALQAAAALLDAAGLHYERETASGDPANTLLAIAERYSCQAIVMGARGVGGEGASGLGSVASAVVNDAAMPVVIVKPVEPLPADDIELAG